MKTLIADRFSEDAQARLADAGLEVVYQPDAREDALTEAIAEHRPDVLVVRSTRVTADALAAGDLKLVIRAGAGFNTIDVEVARERGIFVCNCPGMNANAVAEIAFGLMLALDRRIPENVSDLQRGLWNKAAYSSARGLAGGTLGLVGLGRIGRAMVPRARAFGMPVLGWSRSLTAAAAVGMDISMAATPLEVAAGSDVVSLHLALNDDTQGLVDNAFFEAMRPGAMLINTARAEIVDEAALAEAVKQKGIRAGLDVFQDEPAGGTGRVDSPLFRLDGVIGTHHIGGQTSEAQRAIGDETVRIILAFRDTGTPPDIVWQ